MNSLTHSKKGMEISIQSVAIFIILLIVLIVIIWFFSTNYLSGSENIETIGSNVIDDISS